LTRRSSLPNALTAASIAGWAAAGSLRSAAWTSARPLAFDLPLHRFERIAVARHERHVHALGGERQRDGAADALARAGNERDAPGETEIHFVSSLIDFDVGRLLTFERAILSPSS
jgi:hypothetical protein